MLTLEQPSTLSTFELHALCMYADVLIHAFFVLPFTNGTEAFGSLFFWGGANGRN